MSESVFRYSYSAGRAREVMQIRDKYIPRPESKLEELRRLDKSVQTAGSARAIALGITGCVIFGLGMCFALRVLGGGIALGTFVGVWGMAAMGAAYPLQRLCLKRARARHRERILELAAEICGESG